MKIKIYKWPPFEGLSGRIKFLLLFFSLCFMSKFSAQYNPLNFNTATNNTYNGTVNMYAGDLNWQASLFFTYPVGYTTPVHVPQVIIPPFPPWTPAGTNYAWISYPFNCTPGVPSDHAGGSCSVTANQPQYVYYRTAFTLTNTTYILDLDIWADDVVDAVYINNTPEYVNNNTSPYENYTKSINFKKCQGWIIGQNTIIIRTMSYGAPPGGINHTGLMVRANVPQTVTITPSPPICKGVQTTFFASGVAGATSYNWTYTQPNSFGGGASGQFVNPTPLTPGAATVKVVASSAAGCLAYSTITVQILNTTVTAAASSTMVCAGSSHTLTATGNAANYAWLTPTGSIVPGNPIVVNTAGTYTVYGTGPCTASAVVTLANGPVIPLTAANRTICTDIAPCTTISASTSFTPPVTYSWQPVVSSQPSVIVCPTVSTVYTVTANSTVGCKNSATLAVTVQTCCPPPTAVFALPPTTVCNAYLANLAQYASVTGTFSGVGINYNNGVYYFNSSTSLPPGTYTIAFTYTTAPYGCTYTLYDYATIAPSLPLQITPATTRCAYSPAASVLGATLQGSPASYWWFPNPNTISQTISVSPTVTTAYTVYAIYNSSCSSVAVTTVNVTYTCCPQSSVTPVLGATSLPAGGNLTGPIVIDQNLTITGNGNFTFQSGDFIINDNVGIYLQPGVNLVLKDAHLYGCNQMWRGIEVLDGANVTSSPGPAGLTSLIEDAQVAINVNNATSAHATPLLDLDGVVFNRNWTCISITNSQLSMILLGLRSCVFTNRDLPSGTMSWLTSSTNPGGLRFSTSAATSLSPPYIQSPNYPIKLPKIWTPGSGLPWAISIYNIDNTPGSQPNYGVAWGTPNPAEFNLFDYMQAGVDVMDASLATYNNAFQNIGANCIGQYISTTMNARLTLSAPISACGNRFWHNQWGGSSYWNVNWPPFGVRAENVYQCLIQDATFRGFSSVPGQISGPGVYLKSNRFNTYVIYRNTFSNQPSFGALTMNFLPGPYDIGGVATTGIYAGGINVYENFFGPQINSTAPITAGETVNQAISISGSGAPWTITGLNGNTVTSPSFIRNNTIDRAQNGIQVSDMANYPLGVIENTVQIVDYPFNTHRGISLWGTQGHKTIRNNVLTGINDNTSSNPIQLVHCDNNVLPDITCNTVTGGYAGFSFVGSNTGKWRGNVMTGNTIGLYIGGNSPADIGPQGGPPAVGAALGTPSGNKWLGTWGGGTTWHTMVDAPSNPLASVLFFNPTATETPAFNGGSAPYSSGNGLQVLPGISSYNCPSQFLVQRTMAATGINEPETNELSDIRLYPNPSSGQVTLRSETASELLQVSIIDVTGKNVYQETLITSDYTVSLDLSLKQGIYLVKIRNQNNEELHKKLIIK